MNDSDRDLSVCPRFEEPVVVIKKSDKNSVTACPIAMRYKRCRRELIKQNSASQLLNSTVSI